MERILSWDCAHKSLAWVCADVDTRIISRITESYYELVEALRLGGAVIERGKIPIVRLGTIGTSLRNDKCLTAVIAALKKLSAVYSAFITPISAGAVDLLGGRKLADVSEEERTLCLWRFLESHEDLRAATIRERSQGIPIRVLIEHQPNKIFVGAGNMPKQNLGSTMVSSQLLFNYVEMSPSLVSPKLKNTLALAPNLKLEAFHCGDTQDAKYRARKAHSKANYLHLAKILHSDVLLSVPRAMLDDVADAMLQVLAWLNHNKKFT